MSAAAATDEVDHSLHFGAYLVVRQVGRGGVARVFEAEHSKLQRRVAIKAPDGGCITTAAKRQQVAMRLLREGQVLARLKHPNIIDVFDIGEQDGVPYLVMELVSGGTMAALLKERAPLSVPEVIDLLLPVIAAVSYAHGFGIIHRDLKPENVLLSPVAGGELSPKVADFGVCKALRWFAEQELTHDGGMVGTLAYMAPEQLRAPKFVSEAADQYSLGVMLYQAATGRLPFTGDDPVALMQRITDGELLAPKLLQSEIPDGFNATVLRALATDPTERFETVMDLAQALLKHASRKTWATWASELSGRTPESSTNLRLDASSTWSDSRDSIAEHASRIARPSRTPSKPKSRGLSLGLALGLGALAITGLIASPRHSAEATRPLASKVDTHVSALAPPEALPSRGGDPLSVPVEQTAASSRVVERPRVPPRGASRTAVVPTSLPGAHSAPSATAPRPAESDVEIGRNGAPILQ